MDRGFVERRDGSFYLIGSRVPLGHLVREYQRGESPEAIRSHYPTLSLEQVYGAITFYLGHTGEAENDIAERERLEDEFIKAHPACSALTRSCGPVSPSRDRAHDNSAASIGRPTLAQSGAAIRAIRSACPDMRASKVRNAELSFSGIERC